MAAILLQAFAPTTQAQQRREREPNSVYAERRAKLAAQVDGPIVLWGFTGREEASQTALFAQEENFFYLTGHNEEGAGLVVLPASTTAVTNGTRTQPGPDGKEAGKGRDGPGEMLFLPAKNPAKEKWNGVRLSPSDPGVDRVTGFATVKSFAELKATVENIAAVFPNLYTVLPYERELGGYPHEKEVVDWLQLAAPQSQLKDVRAQIGALRQVKSQGEIAFLTRAIELTLDSHLAAMRMMRPGVYEYQVAAKMKEVHAMGGSEAEGYSPIVGAGLNSTALHYQKLSRKVETGDIVVLDVGAQYSGYSADITRTLPASGKFTPRQLEIYNIVLGAQDAAIAAVKPGKELCKKGPKSLYKISYDYIDSHGKDLHGKSLGQYYIHGLGHHIGLNVHDAGDPCRPLEPGMVVTMEPGVYIPEENLGVRIEDDVLVTESGCKLLSERLPRRPEEIERIMAAGPERAELLNSSQRAESQTGTSQTEEGEIRNLIAKYVQAVDAADTTLAGQVWLDTADISFIHPLGYERGWEQVKHNVFEREMRDLFSERKLTVRDISIRQFGDTAVAEFYWHFAAKLRSDGSPIATDGRETQIYHRSSPRGWALVHAHYSGMPPASQRSAN
jgi:Xaa-Pro aminopeptidase